MVEYHHIVNLGGGGGVVKETISIILEMLFFRYILHSPNKQTKKQTKAQCAVMWIRMGLCECACVFMCVYV